jgi:plastocyanin
VNRVRVSRRFYGSGVAVFAVVLAGCGGGSNTTGQHRPTSTTTTIVVEETEFHMRPSTTKVKLGTYLFKGVNKGTIPHVLELEGPGLENETPTINPGESATLGLTLRNPGKYVLYCPLDRHKQKGMKATFIVER